MSRLSPYKLLLGIAASVAVADQATKIWVASSLPYGAFHPPQAVEVIPGFFHIVHVGNTGAAWSMFAGYTWALALISFCALAAIFIFRRALELDQTRIQLAFGPIIGGTIGNLIDRIRLGHVVDFLDFQFLGWHFPSFNVADSAITVGVAFYLYFSFFPQKSSEGNRP